MTGAIFVGKTSPLSANVKEGEKRAERSEWGVGNRDWKSGIFKERVGNIGCKSGREEGIVELVVFVVADIIFHTSA